MGVLLNLFVLHSQLEKVQKFIQISNERIKQFQKDLEAIQAVPRYEDMTEEEFAYHHPNLALNSLEKPTFPPHTPDAQYDAEQLAYHREMGQVRKEPDRYFP